MGTIALSHTFKSILILLFPAAILMPCGLVQTAFAVDFEEIEYLNSGVLTYVTDACADGDMVYAVNPHGLLIINFASPQYPDTLQFIYMPDGCNGVAKRGDYLYVAVADSMQVYNVVDPYNPVTAPGLDFETDIYEIFIADSLAFITGSGNSLHIVNVSDPYSPFIYSTYNFPDDPRDVAVTGDYLLAACSNGGLQIIDISDLYAPDSVGGTATIGYCYGVDVIGDYAYLADQNGGLQIVDFSTPSLPVVIETYDDKYVMSVEVDYPYLYIGTGSELYVTSHINGYALDTLGMFDPYDGYPIKIFPDGNTLSLTMSIGIFLMVDVSVPSTPEHVAGFESRRYVRGVFLKDSLAYVTNFNNGLFIIDYTDPANLVEIGAYESLGGASEIVIQDSLAVIARWAGGVTILNIKDPANPSFLGFYNGLTDPTDLFVKDTLVYVTRNGLTEGFQILNIADPANPQFITEYVTPGYPNAIFVDDTIAYVADGDSGLHVVDVSDPTNPAFVGRYDTDSRLADVFIQGDLAYIATTSGGNNVHIFDVSDPAAPDSLSSVYVSGNAGDIKVVGDFAFIATETWMNVIDVADPYNPNVVGWYRLRGIGKELAVDDHFIAVADESGVLFLQGSTEPVAVDDDAPSDMIPATFDISQNYPNPFNPVTSIEYSIPSKSHVTIEVLNILGRRVAILVDEEKAAGNYRIVWDGVDANGVRVSSGIYLYHFRAGDYVESKKMMMVK